MLSPTRDSLPVAIAVGRPGEVRLVLLLGAPAPRESILATLTVDKVALAKLPLAAPGGGVLPPGAYAIQAEVAGTDGGARDVLQLVVERLPFDSTPSAPPPPPTAFRPERRRGPPSARTITEGIGLGALALVVPAVVNDGSLSGRSIPPAAWLLGASVAIADIALKRPSVAVSDAARYNELVRSQWDARNRAIALRNIRLARLASLRIRSTRAP